MRRGRKVKKAIKYSANIFIVVIFMFITYFSMTGSRLSSYADIAKFYSESNRDLEIVYVQEDEETLLSNYEDNIISRGIFKIKNPNNFSVEANIMFEITGGTLDYDTIYLNVDGTKINVSDYNKNSKINLNNLLLGAYENKEYNISIYSSDINNGYINYSFALQEVFYN